MVQQIAFERDAVTEKSSSGIDYDGVVRTKRSVERLLLRDPNIVGVSVGCRHVDHCATDEIAICIFVRVKRPNAHLHGSLVPKRIPLLSASGESHKRRSVMTDVQETGSFFAAGIPIGSRILVNQVDRGTANIVFRSSVSDEGFAVSCAHVLDPDGSGRGIISIDGASAISCKTQPFLRGDSSFEASSNLDAGYCILSAAAGAPPIETRGGTIIASIATTPPSSGDALYADLSKSEVSASGIVTTHSDLRCSYSLSGDFGSETVVTNAYLLGIPAKPGDSGSLVYRTRENKMEAVGMIIATNQGEGGAVSGVTPYSVFHLLSDILSKFSLSASEIMLNA